MLDVMSKKGSTKRPTIWNLRGEKSDKWMATTRKGSRSGYRDSGSGRLCQEMECRGLSSLILALPLSRPFDPEQNSAFLGLTTLLEKNST